MLEKLLQTKPLLRCSVRAAAALPYWHAPEAEACPAAVSAERGSFTMVRWQLDPLVLQWLQADPYWAGLADNIGQPRKRAKKSGFAPSEQAWKHEEGGFTGARPPKPATCNNLDCSKTSPAQRVAAFVRAFLAVNAGWLDGVMQDIRETLTRFPSESLGGNGRHFLESRLHDDALAYAGIQVMRPSDRSDPAHFDGAASLLHAGLTVWGRRGLEVRLAKPAQGAPEEWKKFPQQPGSFYIGNLCAPWHQVVHLPPEQAEPLHRSGDSEESVHIAVMLRSAVFAEARARCGSSRASPAEVYDAVNDIVAKNLATRPLRLPTFPECCAA